MKKTLKLLILIAILAGLATLAEFLYFKKSSRPAPANPQTQRLATENSADTKQPENTPADQSAKQTTSQPDIQAVNSSPLPAKSLLDMSFYSQAPFGNWDAIHENTCEEAAVLNAGLYLLDKKLTAAEFDQEMMKMIEIEKKMSINYTDSTVVETKQFSDAYFAGKVQSKIIDNPSIEDIAREVSAEHPIVVPLAGREIGNPNFTPPGPIYHMLVIKGYDSQNYITNDVGTRKGNSYVYKKDVIMKNMHDWNAKDIHNGAKRVLVLYE